MLWVVFSRTFDFKNDIIVLGVYFKEIYWIFDSDNRKKVYESDRKCLNMASAVLHKSELVWNVFGLQEVANFDYVVNSNKWVHRITSNGGIPIFNFRGLEDLYSFIWNHQLRIAENGSQEFYSLIAGISAFHTRLASYTLQCVTNNSTSNEKQPKMNIMQADSLCLIELFPHLLNDTIFYFVRKCETTSEGGLKSCANVIPNNIFTQLGYMKLRRNNRSIILQYKLYY